MLKDLIRFKLPKGVTKLPDWLKDLPLATVTAAAEEALCGATDLATELLQMSDSNDLTALLSAPFWLARSQHSRNHLSGVKARAGKIDKRFARGGVLSSSTGCSSASTKAWARMTTSSTGFSLAPTRAGRQPCLA